MIFQKRISNLCPNGARKIPNRGRTNRNAACLYFTQGNSSMEKTKHITFENLNMSKYLWDDENKGLYQTNFSIRSKTLDIKE